MTDLTTLVPKKIIDESRHDYPQASTRLVIFVATGGLNPEHPWHQHAVRIAVGAGRCIFNRLAVDTPSGSSVVVTARMILMMLRDIGILTNVEFFREGYVVYQNQKWFDGHRGFIEDQTKLGEIGVTHFDAEASLWTEQPQASARHQLQQMGEDTLRKLGADDATIEQLYRSPETDDDET